ncbi:hypothetical protein [Desulfoplanes formicivorans]|uniref:Uncharacterized protein n=1 Tax=Desulfoplanes formicivorans TaxID=1592317 RepID=A0A194AIE1_9BACT|nr:hypothetical protein [Desulfoplanes formicivorans]GAU09000.1 hypothetical protein DPF_1719 [Desulfoplanes formicivorans]
MAANDALTQVDAFLAQWQESEARPKKAFMRLRDYVCGRATCNLEFSARPGVTYSLRAKHANQSTRPLFVMIDVIDDDPTQRWLSVCFYAHMINDPDELGEYAPEGLFGEDACCFDIDGYEETLLAYVEKRIDEAWEAASVK